MSNDGKVADGLPHGGLTRQSQHGLPEVRSEILELVAINQVDLIESLIANDDERSLVARIIADRRNLRDRFAF